MSVVKHPSSSDLSCPRCGCLRLLVMLDHTITASGKLSDWSLGPHGKEGSPCKPLSDSFQSHFRHISDSFQIHFRAIYRQYFGWIQCPSSSWNPTSALTIPEGIRTLLPECRICFFFGNHPHIAALCFADCESWAENGQQCRRCQAESR